MATQAIDGTQALPVMAEAIVASERKRGRAAIDRVPARVAYTAGDTFWVYLPMSMFDRFKGVGATARIQRGGTSSFEVVVEPGGAVSPRPCRDGKFFALTFSSSRVEGLKGTMQFRITECEARVSSNRVSIILATSLLRPAILKGKHRLKAASPAKAQAELPLVVQTKDDVPTKAQLKAAVATINRFKRGPEGGTVTLRVDGVDGILRAAVEEVFE